jgi:class 3 adenylate cyclase
MQINRAAALRGARVAGAVAIVCAIIEVEFHLHGLRNTTVTYSLLLAILFFAVRWGRVASIAASVVGAVGFIIYFQEPVGKLEVKDPQGWLGVIAFLLTSVIVSQVALQAKLQARAALERQRETERLYEFGQALLASGSAEAAAWTAIHKLIPIFGAKSAAFHFRAGQVTHRAGDEQSPVPESVLRETAVSGVVFADREQLLAAVPVRVKGEPVGSLGIRGIGLSETVLRSIGALLTVVMERVLASDKLLVANQELEKRHQQLDQEKRTSEKLLLNILPAEVADEMRSRGIVAPKYFEDVTILFTDFVGFTMSTEKLAAEDLVVILNEYFTEFDHIVKRYGLEKMKTIGDSYMCLSGLPARNPAHPVDTVMAAFEMLEVVKRRDREDSPVRWKIRIGIHTGPVIAGVVGINKIAFDIWGDTVNYSSRMESSGEPNRINLSERTWSRVKDFFECEHRGKVATKEKREYDMYFANGVLPALVKDSRESPPPAFTRRYHVYFQKDPPAFPESLMDRCYTAQQG